ncbi:MAG: ABC transporter permease [Candidatus Cloacimonetes bacterium]|nr:ABC transporter permease [Candidatus Cloacimonadota bacterium]
MFANIFKVLIRNLKKHRGFSFINIIGLAMGITVCFLITIFIFHELSYDRFHVEYQDLFRIYITGAITGQEIEYAVTMPLLADVLQRDFPEVINAVTVGQSISKVVVKHADKLFFENSIYPVGRDFFNVFSYEMLAGNRDTMLEEPRSVLISQSLAKKYFGDEDPLGKILLVNNADNYTVTGVFADIPSNSHLKFNALISLEQLYDDIPQNWGLFSNYTYIRLEENTDPVQFTQKIRNLVMDKMGIDPEIHGMSFYLNLEPVKDIHLYSDLSYNMGNDGNIIYIYIFSAIALFILFIACVNFINLTTAHYTIRAKEIGIRKIIGASRKKVIMQFLWESMSITIIAAIVAFVMIELLLPLFNNLVGKEMNIYFLPGWKMLLTVALFVFLLGMAAGLYPAFYLSAFKAVNVIKGSTVAGHKKYIFRNILVIFQFIISIALISSTIVIYKQIQYYRTKKLGFDKEHVLIIPLRGNELMQRAPLLKSTFEQIPGINKITISSNFPGSGACQGHGFLPEGYDEEQPWLFKTMVIDYDFLEAFAISLKAGRNFSSDYASEDMSLIINETLAKNLGWDDPLGKIIKDPFNADGENPGAFTVIGMVEDFHVNPLRNKIEPMVFYSNEGGNSTLSIKLAVGNIFKTLDLIRDKWQEMNPDMPFDYFFLDERFDSIHQGERKMGEIFLYFTLLAIFIACLGLFGLSSYVLQRKLKEIGIRKVLGSSLKDTLLLLSRDFNKLILLANLVAWPISYFLMNKWLQNFAYRTTISIWVFIMSGLLALFIAFTTMSAQIIRTARINPVDILKYE